VVVACFKVKSVLLPGKNEMTKRNILVKIRIREVRLSHVMFDDIRKEVLCRNKESKLMKNGKKTGEK